MKRPVLNLPLILGIVLFALSCGGSNNSTTTAPPASTTPTTGAQTTGADAQPGTITATAAISGQKGKMYSVFVYDFDWQPGAANDIAGAFGATIDADEFTSTGVVQESQNGGPSGAAKSFAPGEYSVVFYVSSPSSPPEYFTEVRATVAGDITVTAPAFAEWQHP